MNIHDFKKGDIIYLQSTYKWLMRIDRIEVNQLYVNGFSCNIGSSNENYLGNLFGNIDYIQTCRYATEEEIKLYLIEEEKLGIKIPINELYPIW